MNSLKTKASFNVDLSSINNGTGRPNSLKNSIGQAFRRKIDRAAIMNIRDLEDSKLNSSNETSDMVDNFVDSQIGS